MIEVTLEEVREMFRSVIEGKLSREDADRWAYARIQAFDDEALVFSPESDQEKIWGALHYLYGLDLQELPGKYLHNMEDIISCYQSIC